MPLTPLDAEKERFRVGFRGYAREDVERFRAQVIAALEDHITLEAQLKSRVNDLESQVRRYRETEDLLKDSVVLAQRTCDELIAAAHQKADAIKQEAHQEGSRIRAELAELRSQREQFEYAFHGLLAGFTHRLEQGNPALAGSREPAAPELGPGQPPLQEPPGDGFTQELERAPATESTDTPAADDLHAPPAPATQPPAPDVDTSEAIPSVPGIPEVKVPRVPVTPSPPAQATPRPAPATEVDRDADIEDFSAALDSAPAKDESGWMDKDRQSGLFGLLDKLTTAPDQTDTGDE